MTSPPRTRSVFATTPSARWHLAAGQVERAPVGLVHAKVMGTTVTLCGRSTLSWAKFWTTAFESIQQQRCLDCVARWSLAHCHEQGPPAPR